MGGAGVPCDVREGLSDEKYAVTSTWSGYRFSSPCTSTGPGVRSASDSMAA